MERSSSASSLMASSNVTNKTDPRSLNSRVFIGNLNTLLVTKADVEAIFAKYGKVLGCSVHKGYAFVQYANERNARAAVTGEDGRMIVGQVLALFRFKFYLFCLKPFVFMIGLLMSCYLFLSQTVTLPENQNHTGPKPPNALLETCTAARRGFCLIMVSVSDSRVYSYPSRVPAPPPLSRAVIPSKRPRVSLSGGSSRRTKTSFSSSSKSSQRNSSSRTSQFTALS
ncbi:hypothetical protein GOODEAATRI_027451 [Goodea atripinnis]|uniref:RRM domain-containing protein n=1 Tax=Goodea atripinnis TaxID=208336 RepID=A0ABV0NYA0_9TELE